MSPANHNGLDERGVVLMQARSGAWHFLPLTRPTLATQESA